jgi:hypothetical protein
VPIKRGNLEDSSNIAKNYSSKLKNEYDLITYICASVKDIKNWKACTAKRYGQSNEEHFFNRLLKCDRYKQKTIFISFIEKLELKDDRFYKFPSQINEYLGRVGPCKGCCMMRFIVLLKKLRLRKFIKNIRTCY